MNYISKNIRYLRKKANLTQEQFASMVDMNRGNIASYEKGSAEPSIEKLQRIVQYFDTDLNTFIHYNLEDEIRNSASYLVSKDAYVRSATDNKKEITATSSVSEMGVEGILKKYADINEFEISKFHNLRSTLAQIAYELQEVKKLLHRLAEDK